MRLNKGSGTTVAIVIILIILLIGLYYIWQAQNGEDGDDMNEQAVEEQIPSDEELARSEADLNNQSDSDDLSAIEGDLQATSFESL